MFVEWDPEDGTEKRQWDFDPGEVTRKNAQAIEKNYGKSWDQWQMGLMLGEINARAVLLWYMMSLVHPVLQFKDLPDFRVRQLTVHQGVRELKDLWKRVDRMSLPEDQREAFNAQFEADMRDALVREGKDPDGFRIDGKTLEIGAAPDLPKPA